MWKPILLQCSAKLAIAVHRHSQSPPWSQLEKDWNIHLYVRMHAVLLCCVEKCCTMLCVVLCCVLCCIACCVVLYCVCVVLYCVCVVLYCALCCIGWVCACVCDFPPANGKWGRRKTLRLGKNSEESTDPRNSVYSTVKKCILSHDVIFSVKYRHYTCVIQFVLTSCKIKPDTWGVVP